MNPDQSKRQREIALLETVIEKNAAAIRGTRLILQSQEEKQIHRLAELRLQKMLLKWQTARAAIQTSIKPPIQ